MPKFKTHPTIKYSEFCKLFDTFLLYHNDDGTCYFPDSTTNELKSFDRSNGDYRWHPNTPVIYDPYSKILFTESNNVTFYILTYNITEDGTEYYAHPQLDLPVYVKTIDEYLKTHTLEDHFGYKGDVYYSDDNPNVFIHTEFNNFFIALKETKKALKEEDEERLTDLEHRMNELQQRLRQLEDSITNSRR